MRESERRWRWRGRGSAPWTGAPWTDAQTDVSTASFPPSSSAPPSFAAAPASSSAPLSAAGTDSSPAWSSAGPIDEGRTGSEWGEEV